MNNFKIAKAWLLPCVLLLIVFVTMPSVASPLNGSSSPNLVSNADDSTFTDLSGISISPNMSSGEHGNTALSVLNPSVPLSNLATLPSTLQSPPSLSTSLLSSCPPALAPDILTNLTGLLGTIKVMTTLILISVVVLTISCILCLGIIVTRFLPMLKYMCLKTCYPTLSDPSKRLSTGLNLSTPLPIYEIERRCTKLLFGLENQKR